MKYCIIREEKSPPDSRVALTPEQCSLLRKMGLDITVQRSDNRCYSDEEYLLAGVPMTDNPENADILLGVKEVPIENLYPGKVYFMFSHTIKKQSYNRELLRTILDRSIHLIDYEVLTDENGNRVIAFGHFAGMVGAHNAIWTYGKKTGLFEIPRMYRFFDYSEAKEFYRSLSLPPIRIVLTGKGRVAGGAAQVLMDMGIENVKPTDFLQKKFDQPVFTQIGPLDYAKRTDKKKFTLNDFFEHPSEFNSAFFPYTSCSDVFINGIYWDPEAPAFFTKADMKSSDFAIKVIADVTCDIAPDASVPSTLRATSIADPVFGYDPFNQKEIAPYSTASIDVMSIDNLPNEMPRDASNAFGEQFIKHVLPELSHMKSSGMITRGSIAKDGLLTKQFEYLAGFVAGDE